MVSCAVHAACGDLDVDSIDLTVLFGNCLENAIEECRRCRKEKKITVTATQVRNTLGVIIKNSFETPPYGFPAGEGKEKYELDSEKLVSRKTNGGYGLKSMEHVLLKYGASGLHLYYNKKEKTFTSRFVMYLETGRRDALQSE